MSNGNELVQSGGLGSNNTQVGQVILNQGPSVTETREIALDVFKANFYQLQGQAQSIANSRAEEISDLVIEKLQAKHPSGFSKATDPDFQHALFTVQKEYARSGDRDLGELLVDLLVDRSKEKGRSLLQIVLNESLETAPKLAPAQLSALSVVFSIAYSHGTQITSRAALERYMTDHIQPFVDELTVEDSCYQHLEYTRCASIAPGERNLFKILHSQYSLAFHSGNDIVELNKLDLHPAVTFALFDTSLDNGLKFKPVVNTKSEFETILTELPDYLLPASKHAELKKLFDSMHATISVTEFKDLILELVPFMKKLSRVWDKTSLRRLRLTSVGVAIAHANIKKNLPNDFVSLSIWI
ncbi:hypothetical protein JKJ11_24150 [Vibrio sp. SCSIO 43133]|uniref:LPO_1073/Vpar_1526 family protein n=1 Tax=Vibrio sp. SCSIO 43133 TaxID=2802577 RepID=UPI0020760C3D|nr:LPO_1073/Vpar_1526 family protein [Vibrio sp. SCSIO 43133]USE02740.1 hypothetical protein JKJ11_24150 [Vibrio sp. SCSIO 43133]